MHHNGKKCRECGHTLPIGMTQCKNPKCRAWNIGASIRVDDSTVLMSEVTSESVERIPTGLVDLVFGGGKGIARTSVNLLAGEPGAGKTTLSLQLCDVFTDYFQGKEALYIANEQSSDEITETGGRLILRNRSRIRIVKAMGGVTHDIGDLLMHYKPCLTILDSITKWAGEDMALAVLIAQRIKDYCVVLNSPAILVNQVTKGGDHSGLEKLQHAVDMTAMFDIMLGSIDEEGNEIPPSKSPRRLMSSKNRFGPAPEEQYYNMTESGLVLTKKMAA